MKKRKKRKKIVKIKTKENCSEVSIVPTIKRYFYIPITEIDLTGGLTIPSNLFLNDEGNKTTEFIVFGQKGYANLYVNGVIQEGGLYILHTNFLTIFPVNSKILAGTPIIVVSCGFLTKRI